MTAFLLQAGAIGLGILAGNLASDAIKHQLKHLVGRRVRPKE